MSKFDEETVYAVRLTRAVKYRGAELLPLHDHEFTGRALNIIKVQEGEDVIDTAEPR